MSVLNFPFWAVGSLILSILSLILSSLSLIHLFLKRHAKLVKNHHKIEPKLNLASYTFISIILFGAIFYLSISFIEAPIWLIFSIQAFTLSSAAVYYNTWIKFSEEE